MFIYRLLLSGGYLKNAVACSVGRRFMALQTHSYCSSTDSVKPSVIRADDSLKDAAKHALVLRVYVDANGNRELTERGQNINKQNKGKLKRYLDQLQKDFKMGNAFVVTDVQDDKITYEAVALSCCGPKDAKVNEKEGINEKKENVRCCHARGIRLLDSMSLMNITTESEDLQKDYENINEGTDLARWTPGKEFTPVEKNSVRHARANGQLWARYLSQMPPNEMTPEGVVKEVEKQLGSLKVKVEAYDTEGIEKRKMSAFLAVARGSSTKPKLLECEFVGKKDAPLVLLVAKGVTFDSGGLCLKNPSNLLKHEGMTGAAAALGAMFALATLTAPVHVKVIVPLCENMISEGCLRVGEVVTTLKGLKVKVEDTDLEGHLMLADALAYGQATYKPKYIIDVAALTPDIAKATGGLCYGCFTHNEDMWKIARDAGIESGDRPWRFPIWNSYGRLITGDTPVYNLTNRGPGIASHCTGAAFLGKFVTGDNWLHYDITGVGKMRPATTPPYLNPSFMTGRPTRALIAAIINLSNKKHHDDGCPLMQATKDEHHKTTF